MRSWGLASAPDTPKPVSAGPTPRISTARVFPFTAKPAIRMPEPVLTALRAETLA